MKITRYPNGQWDGDGEWRRPWLIRDWEKPTFWLPRCLRGIGRIAPLKKHLSRRFLGDREINAAKGRIEELEKFDGSQSG